jgi:hypothetical protein
MAARRKYPDEMRERAVKMLFEVREREGKGMGSWPGSSPPRPLPACFQVGDCIILSGSNRCSRGMRRPPPHGIHSVATEG